MKIEINEPKTCGECPFYREIPYKIHNEQGIEADCAMGYMNGQDMRERTHRDSMYQGCKLGEPVIKKYDINSILLVRLEMELRDSEKPNESTLEYIIKEDLQKAGYDINYVTAIETKIEEGKND